MASERVTEPFFVVSKGEIGSAHETEYLKAEGSVFGEAPQCEICGQYIEGRPWLPPFRAEVMLHGSEWGDFAFFGVSDFLVSERFARAYAESGLKGLSGFESVELISVKGSKAPAPAYLHVAVGRSGATVDEARSSLTRPDEVTCDGCRSGGLEGIRGFSLEEGTWTGEDVFFARGLTGVVIATARFRDFVDEHGFSNIRFTPTESYEWDPYAPISSSR
jgi:hypothetical protein